VELFAIEEVDGVATDPLLIAIECVTFCEKVLPETG